MQNALAKGKERRVQRLDKENNARRAALCQQRPRPARSLRRWLTAAALTASSAVMMHAVPCQAATPAKPDAALLAVPPRMWAVDAVNNELIALHHPGSYLRYHMHIVDEKGDMTRDLIESQEGPVARLILRNGRPLTDAEDKDERRRLNDMIAHPSDFARHIKNEDTGRKIADDLLRLMPDAMLYTYVPGQPQTPDGTGTQVVLDYAPNPKFKP